MPQRPLVRNAPAARDRDPGDRRVVGFGDDLPAFLARPIPRLAPTPDAD